MKYIRFIFLFLFSLNQLSAQHQDVFPGVSGEELLENLIDTYKLIAYPDQAKNRDTLFGVIDNQNDSLTCVYTSYKIWLNPNEDPTMAAFNLGINTEHTYPKSLGAEGFAEGDMHHLYPTRENVNNDRANLPFGEIPDHETESWYFLNQETSSIPSNNIDLYSERKNGLFEPPEAHKGNVARAMMYFYTMYKDAADAADPNYFAAQRETFCAWHFLDPVDAAEWNRTWKIADFQEGKPNPFVLDCSLPERSYCEDFGQNCTTNVFSEFENAGIFYLNKIAPNPIQNDAVFYFNTKHTGDVFLNIYNLRGELLDTRTIGLKNAGENSYYWENKNNLPPGIIICQMTLKTKEKEFKTSKKAVVIK